MSILGKPMRILWLGLQWLGRQLLLLISLIVGALMLLQLPSLLRLRGQMVDGKIEILGLKLDWLHYGRQLLVQLSNLVKGQLVSPDAEMPSRIAGLGETVAAHLVKGLPVTLKLDGTALALSLALGLLLGLLLSQLAPRWLRAPLWGGTSLLLALPDLLIAAFLQLSFLILAILRGTGPTAGSAGWQKFWAPVIALTLIVAPYIARVVATAIDEMTGEQYIRAAVARGIHPVRILLKHIGRGLLVRLCGALPVVLGLLFAGGAVVEYASEVRGLGRALILTLRSGGVENGLGLLFPFLVLYVVLLALADLIQRWLDPRVAEASRDAGHSTAARPPLLSFRGAFSGMVAWVRSAPGALLAGVGRLLRSLRNPMLLLGGLLVLGLVLVALLAPSLAPFDPAHRMPQARVMPDGRILVLPLAPNGENLLGTDDLGRDLFSQILFGTRYALLFGLVAVPARFLLAVPFGLLVAYRGGLWARLSRWAATLFTAIPAFLVPLALIPHVNNAFTNKPEFAFYWAAALIAIPGIPRLAEAVGSQARGVLALPLVEGAYAVGASGSRVLFRHVLPQLLPTLATMFALEVPAVLTTTALLGYFRVHPGGSIFLTDPPQVLARLPEWGSIMQDPIMLILVNRWWWWAPYVALMVAVLAFNLLGEGMRRVWATKTGWTWRG